MGWIKRNAQIGQEEQQILFITRPARYISTCLAWTMGLNLSWVLKALRDRSRKWWSEPVVKEPNDGPGLGGQRGTGLLLSLAGPANPRAMHPMVVSQHGTRAGPCPAALSQLLSESSFHIHGGKLPAAHTLSAPCISGSNTPQSRLSAAVKQASYKRLFLCHVCKSRRAITRTNAAFIGFLEM